MAADSFDGITVFLEVAERRSFTAAAAALGITPTAASKAVKAMEKRLALPLFQRTTRRVALTDAGAALHARLRPAVGAVDAAFEALATFRDRPMGTLRLTVPRIAVPLIVEPVLPRFRRAYPDLNVEIAVEDAAVDITARGFDAGIRIGEAVDKDMLAVRLSRDVTWCVVGSPGYFTAMGRPSHPEDLAGHQAIRYRFPSSGVVYRWEFVRDGRDMSIDVAGNLIVNDADLLIDMAEAGLGLAYVADLSVGRALAAGRLERVLQPCLPTTPGFFLYCAPHMQAQPKLRAFIDMARDLLRFATHRGNRA